MDGIRQVSPLEARDLEAIIVDVRETHERAQARIPGSIHLPLSELQARWEELPDDRLLILQCAMGGRSQAAAQFLAAHGRRVANLASGIQGWHAHGLPLEA